MKNQIEFIIAFILLLFSNALSNAQTATPPADGDGSVGDPYQIASLENLYWITQNTANFNKYYIQTDNIDASPTSGWNSGDGWSPIGYTGTYPHPFTGSFNGQGYTISDLYIDRNSSNNIGLFGYTNDAVFSNIGLIDIDITGGVITGGLVGRSSNSDVISCYSTGTISGTRETGGLVGMNDGGQILSCYSSCTVTGTSYSIGGLNGVNEGGTIHLSYASGDVSGDDGIGGLVGSITWNGSVQNSYSTSSVSGDNVIGGLVGNIVQGGTISFSYSMGEVSGNSNEGGLLGATGSTVTNCFWDTQTSGQSTSGGGTGKTTAEMKDIATYTDLNTVGLTEAWDFVYNPNDDTGNYDYWDMNLLGNYNDGYPFLAWQGGEGTLPLSVITFEGKQESREVILMYSIDKRTDQLHIEWSVDCINWSIIEQKSIHKEKDSFEKCFFVHENPVSGMNYYRLEGMDENGVIGFSRILKVSFKPLQKAVLFYPNPAKNEITIIPDPSEKGILHVEIIDIFANKCLLSEHSTCGISENLSVDLSGLPSGIFSLVLTQGKEKQVSFLVIDK